MSKQKSKASLLKEKKYFETEIEKANRQIYFQKQLQNVAKKGIREVQAALKKTK